jgi:transposon protein
MKIRKPFVMGGMLLVAALLFLSMFMDMSAPQEMERQTISLRAEAEDLSIDDMINTSDKRKSPSNDVVAPGFAGNVGEYASSSVSTYREDDPEAIARIQAAIRENEENLSAGLRNIEAERKGQALSGQPSARDDRFQKDGMEELEKSDTENDEEMPVAGPEKASPFHSIRLTSSSNRNAIKAYVHSEQVVMAGSTLKMRLGEDAYTDNGVFIPKNSPVYGIVTGIDGERVNVKITHINLSDNILPFAKSVYSKDALLGIYVPGNPKSEITKDAAGGALDGLPTSGIPGVDAAAQVATVVASSAANAGKQALSKNVKKIKVTIKTNYEVYLRPEEK